MQWALLLVAAAIVLLVIGLVVHVLKWLLILAAIAVVIGLLTGRTTRSTPRRR